MWFARGLTFALCTAALWSAAASPLPTKARGEPRQQAAPRPLADETQPSQNLPPEVLQALQRAAIPTSAFAAMVHNLGSGQTVLALNEQRPQNPASLIKLVTTAAALDRLGPAWTWATPVWLSGMVRAGVLEGSLHIKGSGDPKLVLERVWLLLRRVQQMGVREIRGDIVLDNSAFVVPETAPGDFDGEPLRPYNVRASALLLNYQSLVYSFVPDPAAGVARVLVEPALVGALVDRSVPLSAGPCEDWRAALKATFNDGTRTRFQGSYASACGEQSWPLADPHPASYNARLIEGLWREMGGTLTGVVREGPAPAEQRPSFEHRSPPLVEVVREINKFSNNVMAQQLFYTLALQTATRAAPLPPGRSAAPPGPEPALPASIDAARDALRRWLLERIGEDLAGVVIDNGSGLSRDARLSARQLARVLIQAYDSPTMSELMSSLPISGVDGTLRRSRVATGRAHLKTGSLRDVTGVAGYVLAPGGTRYVLVAVVNHANAHAARPAIEALVQWTMRGAPLR